MHGTVLKVPAGGLSNPRYRCRQGADHPTYSQLLLKQENPWFGAYSNSVQKDEMKHFCQPDFFSTFRFSKNIIIFFKLKGVWEVTKLKQHGQRWSKVCDCIISGNSIPTGKSPAHTSQIQLSPALLTRLSHTHTRFHAYI